MEHPRLEDVEAFRHKIESEVLVPNLMHILREAVSGFAAERDWDQFHTPKNLTMSLAGEVGELVATFQWLSAEESAAVMSSPRAQDVRDELADVLIYLVRLADVLDVDLVGAGFEKLQKNALKYPVEEVKGSAEKRKS